jgi:hypothetical protein
MFFSLAQCTLQSHHHLHPPLHLLGKLIIASLTHLSEKLGAYKTISDCNNDNKRQAFINSLMLTLLFFFFIFFSAHHYLDGVNSFL